MPGLPSPVLDDRRDPGACDLCGEAGPAEADARFGSGLVLQRAAHTGLPLRQLPGEERAGDAASGERRRNERDMLPFNPVAFAVCAVLGTALAVLLDWSWRRLVRTRRRRSR
jgi:hypothetical protein